MNNYKVSAAESLVRVLALKAESDQEVIALALDHQYQPEGDCYGFSRNRFIQISILDQYSDADGSNLYHVSMKEVITRYFHVKASSEAEAAQIVDANPHKMTSSCVDLHCRELNLAVKQEEAGKSGGA